MLSIKSIQSEMRIKRIYRTFLKMYELIKEIRRNQKSRDLVADWRIVFQKEYLTIEEAAVYLGVEEPLVRNMTKGKDPLLSYHMVTYNKRWIAKADIDRMLSRNHIRSREDIQEEKK